MKIEEALHLLAKKTGAKTLSIGFNRQIHDGEVFYVATLFYGDSNTTGYGKTMSSAVKDSYEEAKNRGLV